jgi:hypothetical protein
MATNGLQDSYATGAAGGPSSGRSARGQDDSAHGLAGRVKRVRSVTVDDEDELSDEDVRLLPPGVLVQRDC